MGTHKQHTEIFEVYFCTITCHGWLPLFELTNGYDTVYNWFNHLKKKSCHVLGYVIMPNHFHVLLFPTSKEHSLNKLVGEGKRFMAYELVKRLKEAQADSVLRKLQHGVQPKEKAKGKKHQVFKLSFDAKQCFDQDMIEQKLNYIHHNPVSGKWRLVDDYTDYEHSSGAFYEKGIQGVFEVIHYKESEIVDASASSIERH